VDRSLGYAGGEYSANRSSAVQIFTKVADDNDATEEDIVNAYVKANEARRRHQAELRDKIEKAMAAGMTRGEVMQAFKNSGVSRGELNAIMQNRYVPIKISRNLIREVNREVNVKKEQRILNRVPTEAINDVRFELLNTPIIGEAPSKFDPSQPFTIVGEETTIQPTAPEPQPSETFVGRAADAVIDTGRDVTRGLVERARTVAPSLLGGDPASQAANQEILNRRANQ